MLIYSIKGIDTICGNVVRDRKGVNTSRLRGEGAVRTHYTIPMKLRGRHIGSSRIRYIRIPFPSRRRRHVTTTFSIKFRVIGPTRCRAKRRRSHPQFERSILDFRDTTFVSKTRDKKVRIFLAFLRLPELAILHE